MSSVAVGMLLGAVMGLAPNLGGGAAVTSAAQTNRIDVCGSLSALSIPRAEVRVGGVQLNTATGRVEYDLIGAGSVVPENVAGLVSTFSPVFIQVSGDLSGRTLQNWAVTKVPSCDAVRTLPTTSTSAESAALALLIASALAVMLGIVAAHPALRRFRVEARSQARG